MSEHARRRSTHEALGLALLLTVATGAGLAYAFDPVRAGQPAMLGVLGALHALFAGVAVVRLHRRGELAARLRPIRGDVTLGALTAGLLYGAGRLVLLAIASHGSPREAWLMRLYLQLGHPEAPESKAMGAAVFAVALLEETTWRGLVMLRLDEALGGRRALLVGTLLCGFAHAPTAYLLRDPHAGWNPLLVLAALGTTLLWGTLVLRTQRLVPALLSHALFSLSVLDFPLWRP